MTTFCLDYISPAMQTPAPVVREREARHGGYEIPDQNTLFELKIGNSEYPLRLNINLERVRIGDDWYCSCADGTELIGRGNNAFEAEDDWKRRFHAHFQQLYAIRPFEMDDNQKRSWQFLCDIVDVAEYRATTPVETCEIGRISFGKVSYPQKIHWLNGRQERINLGSVPATMAGYKTGQWFEATVHRDPITAKLKGIVACKKIASVHLERRPHVVEDFWKQIPAADLEAGDWD